MWFRLLAMLPAGLIVWSASALAETRIALVIGNSAYKTVTVLPNPANDARAFSELLKAAQFEVIDAPNLSQTDMRRVVREFADKATQRGPDTVSLIYYAGHGVQVDGENYLVPIDADIKRESDVAIEAVRLNDLMTVLASTPSKTRIVILDACRNNPFSQINKTTGRGLAIVDAPTGSVVSYSTAPGMEALDGKGSNSPFTAALVEIAREPNLPIEQAFKKVRLAVHKATEGQQTPWENTSLTTDFSFFGAPTGGKEAASAASLTKAADNAASPRSKPAGFWRKELVSRGAPDAFEVVIREDDVDAYEEFLALYPAPPFATRVRGLLERRREMMTWYTAVLVNTPLAYQAFLDRYPTSDLAITARRLRDRARALSANLARSMPDAGGPNAPACSCPNPAAPTKPNSNPPPTRIPGHGSIPDLGCPPGTVPVNDGTSCSSGGNPQVCQQPKVWSDGECVCPEGTVGKDCHKPRECDSDEYLNDAGKCVEKPSRKTRHHKSSAPSSETGQQPSIELNIGIIGGGHIGGHRGGSPGRMPTPASR